MPRKIENGAPCACAAEMTGPGGKAVAVDESVKSANLVHLRRIEGQIRGLMRMIEEDRYCADIITQIAAVRESLQTVSKNLMRNHLKHCAAAAMREGGDAGDRMIEELLAIVGKVAR